MSEESRGCWPSDQATSDIRARIYRHVDAIESETHKLGATDPARGMIIDILNVIRYALSAPTTPDLPIETLNWRAEVAKIVGSDRAQE